jgi:hypothetical protein
MTLSIPTQRMIAVCLIMTLNTVVSLAILGIFSYAIFVKGFSGWWYAVALILDSAMFISTKAKKWAK